MKQWAATWNSRPLCESKVEIKQNEMQTKIYKTRPVPREISSDSLQRLSRTRSWLMVSAHRLPNALTEPAPVLFSSFIPLSPSLSLSPSSQWSFTLSFSLFSSPSSLPHPHPLSIPSSPSFSSSLHPSLSLSISSSLSLSHTHERWNTSLSALL